MVLTDVCARVQTITTVTSYTFTCAHVPRPRRRIAVSLTLTPRAHARARDAQFHASVLHLGALARAHAHARWHATLTRHLFASRPRAAARQVSAFDKLAFRSACARFAGVREEFVVIQSIQSITARLVSRLQECLCFMRTRRP